jgi:hypothetical protein
MVDDVIDHSTEWNIEAGDEQTRSYLTFTRIVVVAVGVFSNVVYVAVHLDGQTLT